MNGVVLAIAPTAFRAEAACSSGFPAFTSGMRFSLGQVSGLERQSEKLQSFFIQNTGVFPFFHRRTAFHGIDSFNTSVFAGAHLPGLAVAWMSLGKGAFSQRSSSNGTCDKGFLLHYGIGIHERVVN